MTNTTKSLSGSRIQELLWEASLDFQYSNTAEGFNEIIIPSGLGWLSIGKLWPEEDDDGWVIDIGDIAIGIYDGTDLQNLSNSSATTEEELVAEVSGFFERLT